LEVGLSAPVTRGTKAFAAAGVLASVVGAVLVNVAVARHYRRWDLTTHKLYTLSSATVETLHALPERIEIDVLLPSNDAMTASVKFLLSEYESQSDKLDVRYVDPDRHTAEFIALQQKYGIEAGRTEDGQIVTDASIVVSREGKKPFFISSSQLVDYGDGENDRARSRVEQVLTGTIRSVVDDERPKICFTEGHGEMRLDDGGPRGLGELADRLKKNNYDAESRDTSAPNAKDPLAGCRVAVIAGPNEPFSGAETDRIRGWLEAGGNLLVFAGPVPDNDRKTFLPLHLDAITGAGGIALDEDFVFEKDPRFKLPIGMGEQFFAQPKQHDVTLGLVGERNQDLKILMVAARSLSRTGSGPTAPTEMLVSSKEAVGVGDLFAMAEKGSTPEKGAGDRGGPLALAMAAELPRPKGSTAAHGPRLVVVGSSSVAWGQSWQERAIRGGAIFTESALSWLAARPAIVDIPDKPAAAGLRIDESSLGEVLRYVVLYMPAAAGLLGLAVFLRRRSTEGKVAKG
jgi:hypothetical protein